MKVSVHIVTYNQERYISQAIESVLMQEVDFEYEIVIGEDYSTDRTRAIVLDYADRHPDRIRPLFHNNNLGPGDNFWTTLDACRGEYIALLEGDDYWTSVEKLRHQVSLLDSHPEHAFCYHNADYVYDNGQPAPQLPGFHLRKPVASLEDLLFPVTIPTCSVVLRAAALPSVPEWFSGLRFGDWPFWILLGQAGTVVYIEDNMAVYRVHDRGVSSSWDPLERLHGLIHMFNHVNAYLDYRFDRIICGRLSFYNLQLSAAYADRGEVDAAKRHLKQALRGRPLNHEVRLLDIATMIGRLYAPPLYRLAKRSLPLFPSAQTAPEETDNILA